MIRLYAVAFFAGHIGMAMPWSSLDFQSCETGRILQEKDWDVVWIAKHLDKSPVFVDPTNKRHHLKRGDIRLVCMFSKTDPLKSGDLGGPIVQLPDAKDAPHE